MRDLDKRLSKLEGVSGSIAQLGSVFPCIDLSKLQSKHIRRLVEISETGRDGDSIKVRLLPTSHLTDLTAIYLIAGGQRDIGETVFDGHRKFSIEELHEISTQGLDAICSSQQNGSLQ
jgi:hypothetical protein